MWGNMLVKHALKLAAAYASAASAFLGSNSTGKRACIFNYHRVSELGCVDLAIDSWNVSPKRFAIHARWLAQNAECVSLQTLPNRVQFMPGGRPLVALTFDDGFANFRHYVLPSLERYGIPATLFVVTKFIGSVNPYPFDRWGQRNSGRAPLLSWRPITWQELEECLKSGLVSIGSHSHTHPHAVECSHEQLLEEAVVSGDILRRGLGLEQGREYSYPYGLSRHGDVTCAYMHALRTADYRTAVTTNLGLVDAAADSLALPRVEVTGQDLAASIRAKAMGYLGSSRLLDHLRHARVKNNTAPQ